MKLRSIVLCLLILCLSTACTANNMQQQSKAGQPNILSEQIAPTPHPESPTPDLADGAEQRNREPHPMSLADLREKYKSTFLLNGPSAKREIALTFDDAPDEHFTPQILDVLKKEGVTATFFVVGNRVEAHPDIMKRMVEEGHRLGNHSYNHPNLPKLSDAEFRDQINKTDELIKQYTGYIPNIVRPPYGNVSEEQIQWLASHGKKIVNWDVDSLDWKGLSAEEVKTNVLAHVHPGAIILQHSAGGKGEDLTGTVQALPDIINKLRGDGVKLVTIPELLDLPVE